MPDTRLDVPVVQVDGRQLPAEVHQHLVKLRVEESIQLPDSFALHFDDPYFSLYDKGTFAVGAKVEIGMQVAGEPVVVTSGEVTALTVEPGASGRHELVVTGYDLTHRLARTVRRRTFQSMTDGDIASQIAAEHSLDVAVTLPGGGARNDYLLQAGESDLELLRRLATRNGADVWVADNTLHVEPRQDNPGTRTVTLTWGGNLLHFSVRLSAREVCDGVEVRGWDPQRKEAIVAQSNGRQPAGRAAREVADQAKRSFGATIRTSTWLEIPDAGVASTLAESLHDRALAETVVVRGEAVGDPWLGAGATVQLAGVGDKLADDYRVTSVTHLYGPGTPYRTRFVCGGLEPAALADLVGGGGQTTTRTRPVLAQLMVGEVTDTADPEGLGRVRIRLPWLDDQAESTWARLALPGAGPDTGLCWVPAVNDEVVVGFELADPTRPIVLGGLWSQENPAPSDLVVSGHETERRGLQTAKGHRIALDDSGPHIELQVGGSSTRVRLGSDSSLEGEQQLVIKANAIKIQASQSLELSGASVSLSATGDVTVAGHPIKLN